MEAMSLHRILSGEDVCTSAMEKVLVIEASTRQELTGLTGPVGNENILAHIPVQQSNSSLLYHRK